MKLLIISIFLCKALILHASPDILYGALVRNFELSFQKFQNFCEINKLQKKTTNL
jgi:hypothetical protein